MNLLVTYKVIILVAVSVTLFSCAEKVVVETNPQQTASLPMEKNYAEVILSPAEYISWFKGDENHLRKTQMVNGVQYTLDYRSPEFLALMQEQNENITKAELDSAMNEISDLIQFRLQIEVPGSGKEFLKHNLTNESDYEPRVKYFAFDMQKDIYLKTEKGDSIPCSMYHFERTYNVSASSVFLLGFAGAQLEGKTEIIIHEKVFAGQEIRFVFDPKELKNIPQLKTL